MKTTQKLWNAQHARNKALKEAIFAPKIASKETGFVYNTTSVDIQADGSHSEGPA